MPHDARGSTAVSGPVRCPLPSQGCWSFHRLDGQAQEPGGWNRVMLQVADLPAAMDALKKAGVRFRNEVEAGPGGKQIQLLDPDGNPLDSSCSSRRIRLS